MATRNSFWRPNPKDGHTHILATGRAGRGVGYLQRTGGHLLDIDRPGDRQWLFLRHSGPDHIDLLPPSRGRWAVLPFKDPSLHFISDYP